MPNRVRTATATTRASGAVAVVAWPLKVVSNGLPPPLWSLVYCGLIDDVDEVPPVLPDGVLDGSYTMPLLALEDTEEGEVVELVTMMELLPPSALVVLAMLTLELVVALELTLALELTDVVSAAVDAGADVVAVVDVADVALLLAAIDDDSEAALEQTDPGP